MAGKKNKLPLLTAILIIGLMTSGIVSNGGQMVSSYPDSDMKKANLIKILIKEHYLFQDRIDREAFDRAIEDKNYKNAITALHDEYSGYMDKDEAEFYLSDRGGEFAGIGVTIAKDKDGNYIVKNVKNNGNAKKAGMKKNAIILKVDGTTFSKESDLNDVVRAVRGKEGTTCHITVKEGSQTKKYAIVRKEMKKKTVTKKRLKGNVGYIRISEFNNNSEKAFLKALTSMQNSKGFVIDLRNNLGGDLANCLSMLDDLMGAGVAISERDVNGNIEIDRIFDDETDRRFRKKSIVVLINGNSASASEIFAGSLRDYGRATVIGTKSYGKGIIQQLYPLEDKTLLKLTTKEYILPKGESIHGKGVEPNITVEDKGAQLERAVKYVSEKNKP